MAMELIRMLSEASSAFNRVIQQAEEKIFDVEKTEYDDDYIGNVRKMDILIKLTESLIEETESMLEPNPAYRLEGKLMEKVNKINDRTTPLENLGIAFDTASHDVKQYNYELYKDFSLCGKYETKLGVASKEFQNRATEIYVSKLRKMLDFELKKFKEEEEILENLRLDYDSLKIRIKKAITVAGKEALEKEFEIVDVQFHNKLEQNLSYFKSIDHYFEVHRELLIEFIEAQSKFFQDCHSDLEKFKLKMESRILSSINGKSSEVDPAVKKVIKTFHIPKSMKIVTNEQQNIPTRNSLKDNGSIKASVNVSIENKLELSKENKIDLETDLGEIKGDIEIDISLGEKSEDILDKIVEGNEDGEKLIKANEKEINESESNVEVEEKNQNGINLELSLTMNMNGKENDSAKENEDLEEKEKVSAELKIGEEKDEEASLKVDIGAEEIIKEESVSKKEAEEEVEEEDLKSKENDKEGALNEDLNTLPEKTEVENEEEENGK